MQDSAYMPEYLGPATDAGLPPIVRSEIVTVDKRKWLIGMRWRSYEISPERMELGEEAAAMRADWVARRVGDEAIQVGFSPALSPGWPSKIYSLAALLADSHKVPWAGAFDLGDGLWWYIAVRDNYGLMPDGDVVGTFEDIQQARQDHASLEDFNHVNGTLEQLEELIDRATAKRTPIESLTAPRYSMRMVLSGVAVVVALAGLYFAYQYYENIQEQRRLKSARDAAAESARLAAQASVPDAGKILRSTPDSQIWIDACRRAVYSEPAWQMGWQLTSYRCSDSQFMVSWRRGSGATIANVPDGAVVADDGNTASRSSPLPLPVGLQGSDNSVALRAARNALVLWSQAHQIAVAVSAMPAPQPKQRDPATIAATALGDAPPPPIPAIQFSFAVPAAPFALSFDSVPGVRINEMQLDDATGSAGGDSSSWKIAGVVYGR